MASQQIRPAQHVSPNQDDRPAGSSIDMVVLHYTGMADAAAALARLCDAKSKASAHYLIDEDGTVHALVPEIRRAWHAGASAWRGRACVNDRSIGIELVNPGHELGTRPYPEPQMAALEDLAAGILARHPVPPRNLVGHSDVAPTRKRDPGELFDWRRLARAGIGLWPGEVPRETAGEADAAGLLATYGYDTKDLRAAIIAFQRHFRPRRVDGAWDGETAARLRRLLALAT